MGHPLRLAILALVGGFGGTSDVAVADSLISRTAPDCRFLPAHVPEPNVAYVPGVDVDGAPVTTADLGAPTDIEAPDAFQIEIDIDLVERFGIPADPSFFDPEARIGQVEVQNLGGNIELQFNGQPLASGYVGPVSPECGETEDR